MSYKKTIFWAALLGLAGSLVIIHFAKPAPRKAVLEKSEAQVGLQTLVQDETPISPNAINGIKVDEATAQKRPIAVMVENYIDARPQSGLIDADMVYEALAEGGITRFLAVYQSKEAANIGPIRSARTYFAELANEIGALYAHVGGNSDVLYYIKHGTYKDFSDADQFFYDPYYHRIKTRPAPHNVYTSVAKLEQLESDYHLSETANYGTWTFKDDAPVANSTAANIIIDYSLPNYLVAYKYDAKNNVYWRSEGGKPHLDADTGKQLSAKNVIVQFAPTHPIESDTPLSIAMDLLSGGKAYVFMDGTIVKATWKRSVDARTRYYDSNGQEISLNRGQTWVEIVPTNRLANVTWK